MYDELVKRLKNCATQAAPCLTCDMTDDGSCIETLMKQAADAIEELQADKDALNGTVTNLLEQIKDLGKPRWISVTERLPEDRQSVLVHRDDGGIFIFEYFTTSPTDECWIDDHLNVYSAYCVTHWMSLPQPPKEEEE